ncbi:bifunctional diaminohydroxyphosphoribosylaminopyrimidine deaminase/5-amino-6-(5-phosphoribosylamino)uracil reductase RibD [Subtercola boreus]|nr:bifunctional diaminohydroxyphosphoribosylaminopyrimidine deaminase/5-amino-6-(5-phosphoribosylamino)uracil reductase RibD [Subtercola boreus]
MRRAIVLSRNGPAWGVNPRVGAVLLAPDGTVLAEGWHRGAGTPHAEVDALSHLGDPRLALGATAVVTLEPCNHTGRTGPCSTALADAGVSAVYFGISDPGVASAGGAASLAARGVRAVAGLLAHDVEQSIRPWLSAVRTGRPFVTLKWASSLDGRTAAADGTSQWITGPDARSDVHERRGRVDAILVGTGTMLADDPELTARRSDGSLLPHQPAPVVIGARTVPAGSALARHPEPLRHYDTHDLPAVLDDLYDQGVRSVFVEGGPTLASAFVRAGLVDEFVVYLAPVLVGGPGLALGDLGVPSLPDARRLVIDSVDPVGADVRIVARPAPPAQPAPPAPTPALSAPQKETARVHRNH